MPNVMAALSNIGGIQSFGHNRHGPKIGGLCPLFWGLDTHLMQCHLSPGLPQYQVASWSIQPFAHNKRGPKIAEAAVPPFWGGTGSPCNTMSPGLRPTFVLNCILNIQTFGYNRHGPKIGDCAPFWRGELGPHLTKSPGPRPTSTLNGILTHTAVSPQ